jgi:hypothetical protein
MILPFVGGSKAAAENENLNPVNEALFGYIFGTDSYAGGIQINQGNKENYYIPSSLRTVVINDGNISVLGSYAFAFCETLTEITLPAGLARIGRNAFGNCSGLTALVIPESVDTIDDFAFSYCGGLVRVILPPGLTDISTGLFRNCTGLTSVTLPAGLTSIGNSAFDACTALTHIELPNNLTSIGSTAFRVCASLTSIVIPKNVTTIGGSAFMACSGLTVYAESAGIPGEWNASWNVGNRPVFWGCGLSGGKTYVVSFTRGAADILNPDAVGGISAPYRAGYNFEGWATAADATTAAYTAKNVHTAPNGTSLWTSWSPC